MAWARSAGGSSEVTAMTTDADGNVIVTGDFQNIPQFMMGPFSLISNGPENIFTVKYDSFGTVMWAKGSSFGAIWGVSVATDFSGSVYIVGYTISSTTVYFDLVSLSMNGFFLLKYDAGGNAEWVKNIVPQNWHSPSVATDLDGNVYVAGHFWSSFVLGTTTLVGIGGRDIFLAKFDASGNNVWATSASGSKDDRVNSITTDANGYIYLTGNFLSRVLTFGDIALVNKDTTSTSGTQDIFLAKYNPSGSIIWAKSMGGGSLDDSKSVVVDELGSVYIAGNYYSDSLVFDNTILLNPGGSDMFLAKLSSTTGTPIITSANKHIALYPNPNTGKMDIQLNATGYTRLQIFDCLGRQVYATSLTGTETTTQISMLATPSGVYYLHATGSDGSGSIPFVISR